MTIKQLSIFVENKPGRLTEITDILEKNSVDIRALSVADTTNFGILRVIVNKTDEAAEKLKEAGFTVSITSVIGVCVSDCPGGLSKAMHCLYDAGISVEYMYAFIGRKENLAYVILRVVDNKAAIDALQKSGVKLIPAEDIL